MSKRILWLLGLITFCLFIGTQMSCKKDSSSPTNSATSIQGLWVGTYSVDGQAGVGLQYYSLIIKPDGTAINDTKWGTTQHLSTGTWTLTNDSLTCITTCVYGLPSHIGISEKHTAKYNQADGTLSGGVWKNYPNPTGTGTFNVQKIK